MKYEIIKGSEKDFEGAPEWATIVCVGIVSGSTFFLEGALEGLKCLDKMKGDISNIVAIHHNSEIIAERRPITEQVWDGEGLMPLVGMKCLAKQCSQINADEFLVVAIQDGAVFGFWTATGAAAGLDANRWVFLPIPSPEDVAREKITLNMLQYMYSSDETDHAQVCKIYDAIAAGKIPGITKTPTVSELMSVTEKSTREDCEAIAKLLSGK